MSSPSPLMGKSGSYNVPGGTKTRAMYPEATVISGVARYEAAIGSWCSAIHTSLGKTGLSRDLTLVMVMRCSSLFEPLHALTQHTHFGPQRNEAPHSPEPCSASNRQPQPSKFFKPHIHPHL